MCASASIGHSLVPQLLNAILAIMVKTGARVNVLRAVMEQRGHLEAPKKPPAPLLSLLPTSTANQVMDLYRTLGGIKEEPRLAPDS